MKRAVFFLCLLISMMVIPSKAFTWGIATHAFFFHELGRRYGYYNLQEIYGAMLPDLFNVRYESPYRDYMWEQTHERFDKLVDKAYEGRLKAFVFGFVGHNAFWGADNIANEGYVGEKIDSFRTETDFEDRLNEFLDGHGINGELGTELAPLLAENFVETAIDFLVVQNEAPATALRIVLSAELRSYRIPFALVRAYAWDLARDHPGLSLFKAYRVIVDAERGYRDLVRLYGGILMQDESTAFNLLVAQGVGLAEAFL
ncbi:MAG: hypothetical protein GTN81_02800, partial [Proteobacteria bacterium]|nr:hypothetical protein [Pseudomonadota bacterium]